MQLRIPTTALLAFVLLTTACAAGETGDEAPVPDDATIIRVAHDLRSATTLTVYLTTPRGQQREIGVVRAGGTETFILDEPPIPGSYRLVAQLRDDTTFTSQPFVLVGRDGVEWNPSDDIVSPISRD